MIGLPRRIEQGSADVLRLKKGVIGEDLFVRGTGGEKLEQIHDTKPGVTDAGPSTTLAGLHRDSVGPIHEVSLLCVGGLCQHGFQLLHPEDDFLFLVRE